MNNISEITTIFLSIGIAVLALTALLVLILTAERFLRRMARHHVTSTDLDLIGKQAVVTHTIRPNRPGRIYCQNEKNEDCIAEASSDRIIRRGSFVLVTALESGVLRVRPAMTDQPQRSPRL
jgi:membrane protein implicated in regulation of membrane protease activity